MGVTVIRMLGLSGILKFIITRQSIRCGNILAIIDCEAKLTPNFGPWHFFGNPVGVTPIRLLGLSGALLITVTRQSLRRGLVLAIVDRITVAAHPNQTIPSTQFPDI